MVVLASASPRRSELLRLIYKDFTIYPAQCDEDSSQSDPQSMVMELAVRKGRNVAEHFSADDIVISADTCVFINGKILGKPQDENEAFEMLSVLSGNTHTVFTGVCICHAGKVSGLSASTSVTFHPLTQDIIKDYISTKEPMDKAGAYGIQGRGALLVKSIDGDFYNVMGLPVSSVYHMLLQLGLC